MYEVLKTLHPGEIRNLCSLNMHNNVDYFTNNSIPMYKVRHLHLRLIEFSSYVFLITVH
jgi:hypothetical protein